MKWLLIAVVVSGCAAEVVAPADVGVIEEPITITRTYTTSRHRNVNNGAFFPGIWDERIAWCNALRMHPTRYSCFWDSNWGGVWCRDDGGANPPQNFFSQINGWEDESTGEIVTSVDIWRVSGPLSFNSEWTWEGWSDVRNRNSRNGDFTVDYSDAIWAIGTASGRCQVDRFGNATMTVTSRF